VKKLASIYPKLIKWVFNRFYRHPKQYISEFVIPNIGNPGKLIRGIKWKVLPQYKKFPPFIGLDPIVNCNIDCPMCSIPPKLLSNYKSRLTLNDFEKTLSCIKDSTNKVIFCHAGEPFLNKELFDMVKLVNEANIISWVGTNGTLLNSMNIERIIESDLDILQISFDGFSKESYEKYRVGADFNKVLAGVKVLAEQKKKLRRKKPLIEVFYLVNAYNYNEADEAGKYFSDLGVKFIPKGMNLNIHRRKDNKGNRDLEHWINPDVKYSMYARDEKGNLVFKEPLKKKCDTCQKPVINCSGEILLCCHDIFRTVKLGNINDFNFKEYWMSEKYMSIRKLASQRMLPVCKKCGK
tara:strand:- start:1135 stop:2187 length:1053 start_codon:yes stop_codon:yes gene_type:complete